MTTEAILRQIKEKKKQAEIEEGRSKIMHLRSFLNALKVIKFKDSSFDSGLFIKKYKV